MASHSLSRKGKYMALFFLSRCCPPFCPCYSSPRKIFQSGIPGRHSRVLFEETCETRLVCKMKSLRDFRNGQVRLAKQYLNLCHQLLVYQLFRRTSTHIADGNLMQIAWSDAKLF